MFQLRIQIYQSRSHRVISLLPVRLQDVFWRLTEMTTEEAIRVVKGFSQELIAYKLGSEFAHAVEALVDHFENMENGNDS